MEKFAYTVGIFDSGVGGLTVLNDCLALVPECRYLYYGDNLHAPYGNRSEEEIIFFVREALKKFERRKVDAAILACNTATAVAVDKMRREFSFPLIGVEPAVKPATEQGKNVLVLSTPRTTESARMKILVGRFPDCRFRICPAPNLAGAIERNLRNGEPLYLGAHLPEGKFDAVVLGCTHYVFFKREISCYYSAPVFDGGEGTARRLAAVLGEISNAKQADSLSLKNRDKTKESSDFATVLGRTAHFQSTEDTNNCLTFRGKKQVKFLGKCKKINKSVFFRTFVLN